MKKLELKRRIEQEENLLDRMRPSAKNYQAQFQKVKDLKADLEFLEMQEVNKKNEKPDIGQ